MDLSLSFVDLFRKPKLLLAGCEMCCSFSCNVFRNEFHADKYPIEFLVIYL